MKVLMIRPGESPELGDLNGTEEILDYLGGCMETVPYHGYVIVCNDDFLYNGSKYNVTFGRTEFYGNIFVCKYGVVNGETDLVGLDEFDLHYFPFLVRFKYCRGLGWKNENSK